jgi:hypothetical protein
MRPGPGCISCDSSKTSRNGKSIKTRCEPTARFQVRPIHLYVRTWISSTPQSSEWRTVCRRCHERGRTSTRCAARHAVSSSNESSTCGRRKNRLTIICIGLFDNVIGSGTTNGASHCSVEQRRFADLAIWQAWRDLQDTDPTLRELIKSRWMSSVVRVDSELLRPLDYSRIR